MAGSTPVAFVTGASRGIGKAGSLALAAAGYDVVVTARTLHPGETHDYGSSLATAGKQTALPGSLEETAIEVEKRGRRALALRLDLLDRPSIDAAIERTLAEWGRIDVLFNNGIYQGPGVMDPLMSVPEDKFRLVMEGNLFAQFHLTRRVLAHMLERRSGTIVNMTSNAGQYDPPNKTGDGGWGFAYGASKAALARLAGCINIEYRERRIRAFSVNPGLVSTEAVTATLGDGGALEQRYGAMRPAPIAAALVWLASDPRAAELASGPGMIDLQPLVREQGLD